MSQNVWLQMKYKKPANQVLIGFRREIEKEDEFSIWREARETTVFDAEHYQILPRISDFIDVHGDSRYSDRNWTPGVDEPKIYNRSGYWDDSGDSRIYLFFSSALKEATKGFEFS